MQYGEFGFLSFGLVLLGAAVLSVPIARRLGLSAIVAYLTAGIIIGPYGIGVFGTPESIIPVSELGVVMLLFLIGLELELGRLLAMRGTIFGLGAAQLTITGLAIATLSYAAGLIEWRGAIVAGLALAMSATAIALQILEERGQLQQDYGQRAFAILLFQDMAVVPLLAVLPLLAPAGEGTHAQLGDGLRAVGLIAGAIALIVLAGRYLLNPFFRLLAQSGSREVMTAAALLVVLGAALTMQKAGMSMALGAFLAGVLLAESNYRHELEADIEPFRGLLLALFFMGIGMSIDLVIVRANLWLIAVAAITITILKAAIVWLLFRATCVHRGDALRAGSVLTGAGEFAFVLIPLGGSLGVLDPRQGSILTAIAATTMLLGPLVATLTDGLVRRWTGPDLREPDDFSDASGSVLVIGFGRFGQIVSQCLLAEGIRRCSRALLALASKFITATAPGSTSCERRAPERRGSSRYASIIARRQAGSLTLFRRNFPPQSFTCALSTGGTRCSSSPKESISKCEKPMNRRSCSDARRWKRWGLTPSARPRSRNSFAVAISIAWSCSRPRGYPLAPIYCARAWCMSR